MTTKNKLLIYGAAGYTGTMISERAKALNLDFEIAGRELKKIKALAEKLNVPYRVFSVDDKTAWKNVYPRHWVALSLRINQPVFRI